IAKPTGGDVKPVIVDSTFRFNGIKLTPGLNKITVSGTNNVGNYVKEKVYINYSNAPMLYDIKSADGRILSNTSEPTVIDTRSISLKANNVKEVYIGGKKMYSGDGTNYVASDLPLNVGRNTLVITATNGTKSITETREVIYYTGTLTAYDVKIGSHNVERGGIISDINPISGAVSGALVFKLESSQQLDNLQVSITDQAGNTLATAANAIVDPTPLMDSRFITFKFNTDAISPGITTPGKYNVLISGKYAGKTASFSIDFTYRQSDDAYITDVKQVFNVNASGDTYERSAPLTNGALFLNLPSFAVKTSKSDTVTLTSSKSGLKFNSKVNNSTNETVFVITEMAPGQQTLTFETSGTNKDTKAFTVTYVSAPYLEITNIPNGKKFYKSADFNEIIVKYTNFTDDEAKNLTLSLRGKTIN
ncbi:hypothetical protein V7139_32255, partial [Neobacillus drentensis]|uniref:hypothetical protein n=1 Tax=Neobacillus drentensis TaxID=220684 RepID=UPI0030026561